MYDFVDFDYEFVLLCVFLFVILAHVFPFSQQPNLNECQIDIHYSNQVKRLAKAIIPLLLRAAIMHRDPSS